MQMSDECQEAVQNLLQLLPGVSRGDTLIKIFNLLQQAIQLAEGEDYQVPDPQGEVSCESPPSMGEQILDDHMDTQSPLVSQEDEQTLPQSPLASQEVDQNLPQSPLASQEDMQNLPTDSPIEDSQVDEATTTADIRDTPQRMRKRPRRSEGGSQRTYTVRNRGYISYSEEDWGICPVTHVASRTAKEMLQHAAESNTKEFASLAGYCLKTGNFQHRDSLADSVRRLSETSKLYNPYNTEAPDDLSEAALRNWSCTKHLQTVLDLIHVSGQTQVCADYQIGRYLGYLSGTDGIQTTPVIRRLCNEADSQCNSVYRQILRECNCPACCSYLQWMETKSNSSRPNPCPTTEVKAKVLLDCYKNCTPTYLTQCCSFGSSVHPSHPVLLQEHVAPNRVRQLAPELKKCVETMLQQGSSPSVSPARLGQGVVFELDPKTATLAIDYVDGDGGFLAANHVPGFQQYVDDLQVPSLDRVEDGGCQLVAFRELYHDAVELNHVYRHIGRRNARSLGVEALRVARGNIATSSAVYICCNGEVDFYRKRVLAEILFVGEQGLTSNGEVLISKGLSVPLNQSPASYSTVQAVAERNSEGVYAVFPAEVGNRSEVRPEALRRECPVEIRHNGEVYAVTPDSELRNESHVVVRKSTIDGAGNGLFLRANLSSRQAGGGSTQYVKARSHLCVYSQACISRRERESLENTDYTLETGQHIFDGSTYNGVNMGRFVNQGGLLPAFIKMVRLSKRDYHEYPNWKAVEQTADFECNVTYHRDRTRLTIVPKEDLHLGRTSTELFANYSIREYWVPYFATKVQELGTSNRFVKAILWCACSPNSNWSPADKKLVHVHLRQQNLSPEMYARTINPPW